MINPLRRETLHDTNLCQEIYLPASYEECMLGNTYVKEQPKYNTECVHALNVSCLTPIHRRPATDEFEWAIEMFGADNIDFFRPGECLYFKNEAEMMLFALRWL